MAVQKASITAALESRVGRLEGTVEQIQKDIQENSRALGELAQTITVFKDSMMSQLGKATTPRWPLIIGVATLFVTICALIGGGFTIVMSGHSDAIKAVQSDIDVLNREKLKDMYDHGRTDAFKELDLKTHDKTEMVLEKMLERQIQVLSRLSATEAKIGNLEHDLDITDSRRYNEQMEKYRSSWMESGKETKTLDIDKLPIR